MQRVLSVLSSLALLIGACGQPSGDSATTTIPDAAPTTEVGPGSTTTASSSTTSTLAPAQEDWTVSEYGTNPTLAFGERGELGSGCSPGTDLLPDGIWFGWVEDVEEESISFDLACLWPGRLEPAASNDASRIRDLPLGTTAVWYDVGGDDGPTPAINAPGLPETLPYWLFINDGTVTEMSEYPEPVTWARSESAWPNLVPGCCDGGDVAPPSAPGPLPDSGWPTDGFYKVWFGPGAQSWIDLDDDQYVITIAKWLSCRENPGLCPEWWIGDEVYADFEGQKLIRNVPLSAELTVVIEPIFGEGTIVGDGVAFGELITDMNESVDTWVDSEADLVAMSDNPVFPFGVGSGSGSTEQWPIGYRAPGGTHLTWEPGWLALEIRNGRPILYIHAGLVAG